LAGHKGRAMRIRDELPGWLLHFAGSLALFSSVAWADTLTASPSGCTSVSSVGTKAWTAPGNATATDGSYATVAITDNETSYYLQCLNYGFASIPTWAVINGLIVNVVRKSSSTTATVPTDANVRLLKAGTIGTTDRATTTSYTTADVTEAHGGATDLWGTTWTPADLKATNFGVAFATKKPGTASGSRTVSVDYISVVANYTIPPRSCVSVANGAWSSATTWNCGSGPGDGPPISTDSATINGQTVSLDTSATVTSLTINSGILQQTGSTTQALSVTGNLINSGTIIDNGTSGSLDLTIGGSLTGNGVAITVDNLAVTGGSTINSPLTVNGSFNVSGDLTNNSSMLTVANLVFQKAGTQAATFYGTANNITNFIVNSGSTVSSTNYSSVNLKGTLTNNGVISLPNTSWTINGSAVQGIAGSAESTLGNLTINNPSGLTLNRNVSVSKTVTLTSGVINTGTYTLTSTANCPAAVSGGSASSYVNGNLRLTYPASNVTCVYPVGDTAYAPITVAIPYFTGIAGGTLTGSTTAGEHAQVFTSGIDSYQDVTRNWTLGVSGDTMATLPSAGSYSVNLGFASTDVDAGAIVSSFKVGKYASSTWSTLAGSASGTTATLTGQTSFGSFAVGTPLLPVSLGKTASSSAAAVNSYVTFTLSVTNSNTTDLSNVVLTDVIPTEMTYKANAATLGTATATGQTLTWIIPALSAGANAQLTLVVQPTIQGTFTNTVTSGLKSASATILILPNSYVNYRMDQAVGTWTTTTSPGTVIDSGINGLNGHLKTTSTPTTTNAVSPSPAIGPPLQPTVVGGFCNAGSFDGKAVVETPYSSFFQFTNKLSASAWIYPKGLSYTPSGGDLSSILSNDTNYEFHLDSTGHLYWWWNYSTLTSAKTIPLNQWTHVAITMDSSTGAARERIYINGVADTNTNNWSGTLLANACPFYIGGDITTGASCALIPGRNFQGMIDEVKIYDYELSAAEVQADMTLGRQCGATFDHIRIEHDGSASTCTPKTVTLKACLNSSCTALYPGPVQVTLTPSGWTWGNPVTSSDTVTITNGVTTATLNNSSISAPTLTLGGTAYGSTLPTNTTVRCFNGTTETCALSVASTACNFDAVEVGANPQTHLYTKLASTPFSVDILALSSSTKINTAYIGSNVDINLVDTSASACSGSSTVLSNTQTINFASTDKGRKSVSLTAKATPSAQVRIKSGSAYACSYDKLAVRPTDFTVTSSANADPAGSNASASPVIKSGASFTLTADSGAPGYNGTPKLNSTKIVAHTGAVQAGTLAGSFSAADSAAGKASGSAFTYSDVGYFNLATDAVYDDTFTAVDSAAGDCTDDFSPDAVGGKFGCKFGNKTATSYFGRFVPDHFTSVGAVGSSCVSGTTFPTYMDQPFTLSRSSDTSKAELVEARNLSNGVTKNYTGSYAPGTVIFGAENADNGTDLSARLAFASSGYPVLGGSWSSGIYTLTSNATSVVFKRPTTSSPDATWGPFDTLDIGVTVKDTDVSASATINAADMNPFAAGGTSFSHKKFSGTPLLMRYGRLRVLNANGSNILDLPMAMRAEYWKSATNGWQVNSADICTTATLSFSPVGTFDATKTCVWDTGTAPGNSGMGCVASAPSGKQFREAGVTGFAGDFNLWLKAPNIGGALDVTVTDVPDWLKFNWTGTVDQPTARATFGISKSGKVIHLREMY